MLVLVSSASILVLGLVLVPGLVLMLVPVLLLVLAPALALLALDGAHEYNYKHWLGLSLALVLTSADRRPFGS